MTYLVELINTNQVLEVFGAATAAVVTPIGRIGYEGKDMMLPSHEGGLGPVGRALFEKITDIQEGRVEGHEWSRLCAE
jgi:branched-chain amino acid aminotransferase